MNITRNAAITLATIALASLGLTACSSSDSDRNPEPAMTDSSIMDGSPSPAMSNDTVMESPEAGDDAMMSTTSP
ncbi:MAG: hypothetical protein Q7K25_01540 [Actinomycetota bacterium]|nr:hypothetical protein [Actinomycetota bacterium]